jgi:hypothetical protein
MDFITPKDGWNGRPEPLRPLNLRQLCGPQETKAESRQTHQAKERGKPEIVPLSTGNNDEKRQPSLDGAFPFDGPAAQLPIFAASWAGRSYAHAFHLSLKAASAHFARRH